LCRDWPGSGRARRHVDQAGEKLGGAAADASGLTPRAIDIGGRRPHALAVVAEQPERGVALVAQEPAHL
jgi:hypothetical protein